MKRAGKGNVYKAMYISTLLLMVVIDGGVIYFMTFFNNQTTNSNYFMQNLMIIAGIAIGLLAVLTLIAIFITRYGGQRD